MTLTSGLKRAPFVSIDGMRRIGGTMVDLEWVRRRFILIGKLNCVIVSVAWFPVNFVTIVNGLVRRVAAIDVDLYLFELVPATFFTTSQDERCNEHKKANA
jgi:hypothetical protein